LAAPIPTIVENEHRQSDSVEFAQILQPVDDIPGVAVAPEYDRTICLRLNVPTEQPRSISSLKPHIFQRQATADFPVVISPRLGMVDEELIKNADSGLLVESQ
jgi:hypothetical protein